MKLSAVVLTKNEEGQIEGCLESIRKLVDEIVVVDSGSTDKTIEMVKKYTDKIRFEEGNDFSFKRNLGLKEVSGDWVLYVDADERVTPELKEEIESRIMNNELRESFYKIPRKNFYFGNNEWPYIEKLERLFRKAALEGWQGKLHESPIIKGETGDLQNYLLHYTHRDLYSMVEKTIEWSKIEAELRLAAGHPPVSWWRFPRVMLGEFYRSYLKQSGWKTGTVGIMESLYQAFSIFVTYARLWEMQNKLKIKNEK